MRARLLGGVAVVAALFGLCCARASAAVAPPLVLGQPFAFTGGPVGDYSQVVASALEGDGTAWDLTYNPPSLVLSAASASGTTLLSTSIGAPDTTVPPLLAVADGTATVAWLAVSDQGQLVEPVSVHAEQCTLNGCGPGQTIASWDQKIDFGGAPINPQLALASVGGRAVLVFQRFGVTDPQMMWAQSDGSRFSAPQSFGVQGNSNPAIVSEPNGRIFAAWFSDGGMDNDIDGECPHAAPIEWSQWSPGHGFSGVHSVAAGSGGFCEDLNLAATTSGVTLAWLRGPNQLSFIEGPTPERVWVSSQHGNAFSKPRFVIYDAVTVSLAAASNVIAVGAATEPDIDDPGDFGPVVTSSVAGAPFSTPVLFYGGGEPPNVSVDSAGDVLVTWFTNPNETPYTGSEELAIAPPGGSFGAPIALGLGVIDPDGRMSGLIDTVGQESFITLAGGVTATSGNASICGVFATP